jgi:hypothetical protein
MGVGGCRPAGRPINSGMNDFSIGSLTANPNFDFIHNINSNTNDDHGSLSFFDDNDDSPYNPNAFQCSYVDINTLCSSNVNSKNLTFMSLNIQSLPAKYSELKDLLNLTASLGFLPDIIMLQEIWQVPDASLFPLSSYQPLLFKCRERGQGGGVGIYVKNGIKAAINPNSIFLERVFESILVDLSVGRKKYTVGSMYRCISKHPTLQPKDQFSSFNDLLFNMLSTISSGELILGGDFNLDVIKYQSCSNTAAYIDNLFSNGCIQIISKPTRISNTSASCIDHFVTNCKMDVFNSQILLSKISDHLPIFFNTCYDKAAQEHKNIVSRDFSESNIQRFSNQLAMCDWNPVSNCNDPNTAFNLFENQFSIIHNQFFKPKLVRFNKNVHRRDRWMTLGLLKSRMTKMNLSKKCFTEPSVDNNLNYKNYRNLYNKLIRLTKKSYYEEVLKANVNNSKKTWDILNEVINKKRNHNPIESLNVNGTILTDPKEIADRFNLFFTSIAQEISSSINPAYSTSVDQQPNFSFSMSDSLITLNELNIALCKLQDKTSLDMNNVSMFLLKRVISHISEPILHIFNQSLICGVVPNKLKIAKVIPIFKSGDAQDMNNYRPISLLCSFSKVLEKIVFLRLIDYLETNNILSNKQYGF